MKTVKVVAAIIKAVNENGETIIFATQRGYGDFKGGWEFPGGKIESGETPQEALKREIIPSGTFLNAFPVHCTYPKATKRSV